MDGSARRRRRCSPSRMVEALAMLTPADPSESQYTLQRLADRFAPTDPKKALLFAEESVVRARAEPARPHRRPGPGRDGARPARPDRGRTQADRRGRRGRRAPGDRGHGRLHPRRRRPALAPVDADRALALLEPLHGNDRYAGFVAGSLAAKDQARAVALADAMAGNGPSYPDQARTEIAIRFGADRPDLAIQIIEGMKSFAADYMRAEAFALLAIAVARATGRVPSP